MRGKGKKTVSILLGGFIFLQSGMTEVWAEGSKNSTASETQAEEAVIGSDIWETPVIPDAPVKISGVSKTSISLNETSGDGTWKFLYDIPDYTQPDGVPAPGEKNQDFDFTAWDKKEWKNIIVPGEAVMQGFDIQTNNEYYYQRSITIPEDFKGNRILVRFDGVYSNARVWIDGKYIRTHVGGFTTWDCDITNYAGPGETVTMTVGVTDIYSDTKGIWNPEGEMLNNPSNATEYAHHNVGGILRDVSLIAMPEDCIARTYVETELDENFVHADLEITAQLAMVSDSAKLRIELLDQEDVVTEGEISFEKSEGTQGEVYESELSLAKKLIISVENPRKWDAEHPNLYTLRTTLEAEGKEIQVNEEEIGFREIHYSGKDGTDGRKVYVNGQEVKLRGTCRHDVSDDLGRSMTRAEAYAEAEAYKNANINFIRTSHYPASEDLLDACDEMGIYVEQETAVCFQGYGSHGSSVYSKYEDYLPQFAEMIERDRNRASILIWSLGNESNYGNIANQSGGNAIQTEKEYLSDVDTTRPCIFSWPNTGEPWELADIYSQHYANISGWMGSDSKPVLHDEYAHVACYNMDELQRDVNVRNFWGESIKKAWENIFTSDGALGGALWGGIDDVFYIPEGTQERWQSHSDGQTAGYGEWGSVLDAYLREKPEAYLTKKAYSPVRVDEEGCYTETRTLYIPVKNWFDHTDFNELEMEVTTDRSSERMGISESIAPHSEGVITAPGVSQKAGTVNLKFYTADGIMVDEYNVELGSVEYSFAPASENPPEIQENESEIKIKGAGFEVAFSKETGLISRGTYGEDHTALLTGGPYLHVTGTELGSWIPDENESVEAEISGNYAVVTMKGRYENGQGAEFRTRISGNGILTTVYTLTSEPPIGWGLQETGISYDIPSDMESVSWQRDGLYSAYPEDHIGRTQGTALKVREGAEETPDQYGVEPSWSWKDDMKNYFVYAIDNPNNGLVTNDFKTMRENIHYYDVNYGSGDTYPRISVESKEGNVAARVDVSYRQEYIDDRDSAVLYSGSWNTYEENSDYAGTETYSSGADASCELTFEGTGIRYIGSRQNNTGKVKVYIDGELMEEVDTYSDLGNHLKQSVIYSVDNLEFGEHTIRLETSGGHADCIVVDAFEVLNTENENAEQAQLIINHQWYYPNLAWGNYTGYEGRLYNGSTAQATIRLSDGNNFSQDSVFQEYHDILADAEEMTFTGSEGTDYQTDRDEDWTQWAYDKTVTYLLDTKNPTAEHAGVTFTFHGTGIRWIGGKEENQGIAQVIIDGAEPEEVDLFSESKSGDQKQEILYEKMWEEAGTHTITIQRSGRQNPQATAGNISLDAFVVINPGEEISVSGIELGCTEAELEVGEELALTASVQPENAGNKEVKFTSDNEEAAVVSEDGVVTAVGAGKAVITAESADGGFTAECLVTVKEKGPSPEQKELYSLKLAVDMAEKMEAAQMENQCYTEETWAAVQEALNTARALLETENVTPQQAEEAFLNLITACNLLENGVQKVGLKAAIKGTKEILADSAALKNYTPQSVENVRIVLAEAERVFAETSADQETVNAATTKLLTAVTAMMVREEQTRLDILIQKAEEMLQNRDLYTPSSAEVLEAALEAAKEAAENQGASEEEIQEAYNHLAEAMMSLVRKANKEELKNALDKANEILSESDKYLAGSLEELAAVTEEAQAVYDNEEAFQDEIGEILKNLIAEILEVRLMGDVDLNGTVDSQDAAKLLRYDAELESLAEEQLQVADVNSDTLADSNDAAEILKYAAEIIDKF